MLNGLNLPSSLRKIGARAFSGCKAITHVEFPDNIDTIQANAFQACSSLTSVDFNNVICISDYAFSPCPIKNLDFNSGLDSIGKGAFQGNLAVEALVLPESLKTTGKNAFADCKNLKTADLKNLTYLNNKILTACFNLEDITLSSNVEYVANDAFDRDSLLRYVYVHYEGQAPSAFADCYFADENLTHNVTIYVQDDLVDQFKTELTNFNGSIRGFEESTPVFVKYVKIINVIRDQSSVSVSNVKVESMAVYTASGALVRTSKTNKISTDKINKGDMFIISVFIKGLDQWVSKKFIK